MRKRRRRKTYKSYKRKRNSNALRQALVKIFKLILLLGASSFVIYYFIFRSTPKKPTVTPIQENKVDVKLLTKPEAIDYTLDQIFNEFGLLPSWITKNKKTFRIRLPRDAAAIVMIHKIINKMKELDCSILKSREDLGTHQSILEIGLEDKLIRKLIIIREPNLSRNKGKIAIIIDDLGYNESEETKQLLTFPYQISLSIIPGLVKSAQLYQQAQKFKKETIIHLPMEADEETVEYTDYTLYTNMTDAEITRRVGKAIADFPDSKGINNHMGSRATGNKHVMQLMMQELKKKNKYFIDSKTTNKSVAYQTAKEINVPCSENDIFLDRNRNDNEEYLRKKLLALTKIVEKKGRAVAIGHPYSNTIKVLIEEIPELEKQGFVFVPVSEVVK